MFNRAAEVGLQYKQNKGKKLFFLSCNIIHLLLLPFMYHACVEIYLIYFWALVNET